jgi:CBS domain-containing protein
MWLKALQFDDWRSAKFFDKFPGLLNIVLGTKDEPRSVDTTTEWRNLQVSTLGVHVSNSPVHCIKRDMTVTKAWDILYKSGFRFRHLLVTEDGKAGSRLIGLVSLRKLEKAISRYRDSADIDEILVDDESVMHSFGDRSGVPEPRFLFVYEHESLEQCLKLFVKPLTKTYGTNARFYMSAIPIVDKDHQAVGIISFKNILNKLLDGTIPMPTGTVDRSMRQLPEIRYCTPVVTFANAKGKLEQVGQRDLPIVENMNKPVLVGFLSDSIMIDAEFNPRVERLEQIENIRGEFRMLTRQISIKDMLVQYVNTGYYKTYYSFPVVNNHQERILQGLIGYRDIFKSLLNTE